MSARALGMNDSTPMTLPRFAVPATIVLVILALGLVLANLLRPLLNRPVVALRVDGQLRHLDAMQIANAVGTGATTQLFAVDLDAARARVEALPWVAHARVSRIWPDQLAVRVTERVPYARWGAASLIDTESRVFTPPAGDLPAADVSAEGLPQLLAPEGHEAEVAATFESLRKLLDDSPFKPSGLTLDARGEWRLQTLVGIELRLGKGDPLAQTVPLLGAVRHTLADQLDRVAYIDLRYANGFAVGWASGHACEMPLGGSANARPGAVAPECKAPGAKAAGAGKDKDKSGDLLRSPNAKAEERKR